MSLNLDYFMNLDSVPEKTNEREKLNTLLLGPTSMGLGIRQFANKTLQKTKIDFIVYVKNDKGTWDKGKLLYCHLTSNTSDVKIMATNIIKKGISNDNILTEKGYNDYNKNVESNADTPKAIKMNPSAEKIIINSDTDESVDTEADTPRANIKLRSDYDDTRTSLDTESSTQDLNKEIGGRKKRTRKQKPRRRGMKTKKSRFSAKKSRRNRRKGKTTRKK